MNTKKEDVNAITLPDDKTVEELNANPSNGLGATTSSSRGVNQALSLDGIGDYVYINAEYNVSSLTVEAWVKPASGGGLVVYGKEKVATWEVGESAFAINWNAGSHKLTWIPTGIQLNIWYHTAVTYDGRTVKIYINAELRKEELWEVDIKPSGGYTTIGVNHPGGDEYFFGQIDEVRIFNYARSQEEIQSTMNNKLTGLEDGLVGYWNFDDGAAKDLSENGNDGVLHGDAQIVKASLPDEFIHQEISVVALEDKTVNPDDQFAIDISVRLTEEPPEGAKRSFHSFTFDLAFDPAVLRVVSVKEGDLSRDGVASTSWQTPTIDNKNGLINNIRCGRTAKEDVFVMGVLAMVTFEALDIGSTDLLIKNLRLLSPTVEKIVMRAKHGKIDVYPHGSISGVVLDGVSEEPVPNAKVEVKKNDSSFLANTRTDANGKYIIKNAPVGIFGLKVSKEKYWPKVVSNISVKQGEVTPNANIAISMITPIWVGDEARDFTLLTVKGNLVTLSDFFGKKIVVLSVGNPYGRGAEACVAY